MAMILGAFVPKLIDILSQMAQDEVGQLLGVPREVDKLNHMVYQIQGVLIDAEKKQNESEAINRWVKQLKDVMYDADDVIDLCRIKTDERRARFGSSSSTKMSCSIHFLSCFRNPLFAHKIAGQIKELNSRMNEIVSQIGLLDLIENRGASSEARQMASNISRRTHPVVVLSDIVGDKINKDAEQVVELIIKDATEEQGNIPIVAIVGMGGIGKTTLAKMVYNDPRIKVEFKSLIWICVSKELRPVDILQNVMREIGGDCDGAEEISELVPKLEQCIRGKKFLLVIDDIWEESEKVWDDYLSVPMSSGAPGSRVLITTRNGGVAKQLRAIHTQQIDKLSDEDGWSLLVKQVVPNGFESEIQDLNDIGMQIVKKCDGLPLAIKSIAGVLRTKGGTRSNWQAVLRNNVWSMDILLRDVHQAFYLSYEDLPPPLKQCFIFCSLFPEDFVFCKTDLIYLWLAEGFVQDKEDFWELGYEYYIELQQRNLLEANGSEEYCKMHDILWSFACQLGKDENCVLWKGQDLSRSDVSLKVRRLSIKGNEVPNSEAIKKEKWLRTILHQGIPQGALDDLCKGVSKLHILEISKSDISSLPNSLCDLVHLRYLDVSESKIKNLPNSIGNLKYLVYLNLNSCRDLSHLPRSIINLRELRYLNTSYSKVEAFPAGLNKLDKLTELHGFWPNGSRSEGFSNLDELESLSQLIRLSLNGLERLSDQNIAKRANLRSKSRLRDLQLFFIYLDTEEQVSLNNEKKMTIKDVLNEFSPPSSLETLSIYHYFGIHLPNWLNLGANLPNLKDLYFENCSCLKEFESFGQLPNLEHLFIMGAHSIGNVGEEFLWGGLQRRNTVATNCPAKPAFPKLNTLYLEDMSNWEEWQWNKGQPAMPKLKRLTLAHCPQLRSLPEGLLHYATSLEFLRIDGPNKLITIENLPSITEIVVLYCSILERISNLPRISCIQIDHCPNLKALENLNVLQEMELYNFEMETLPEYLMTIMPQKLTIQCREELVLKIASQGESGSECNKFKHIAKVIINSSETDSSVTYREGTIQFHHRNKYKQLNASRLRFAKEQC